MTLFINIAVLFSLFGPLIGAHGVANRPVGSLGCRGRHNYSGETRQFSFNSPGGGGTRFYQLHLPSNYDARKARPLMIAYHGHGNNPRKFEKETRFSDEHINPNMIVVYPEGIDHSWQGPTYARSGINDEVFTSDLVDHIKNNYCVDEARVYATGHSNGAGFVNTLACSPEHGEKFAAFAPISGAFYSDVYSHDNCTPSRSPLAILEVHGSADSIIPYFGTESGKGGPLPSIPDWVERWARRNQCNNSQKTDLGKGVNVFKYECRGALGVLEHMRIDGHDHSWPGPASEIDISPRIVQFLTSKYKVQT